MPKATVTISERIALSEMLTRIRPLMSRSAFYGSRSAPGPRWTLQDKLDIRIGSAAITANRNKFEAWFSVIQGSIATGAHPNAQRLGLHAVPAPTRSDESYGVRLAVLCEALAQQRISQEQFDAAVESLGRA
jgi:hypothetical protein